MNLANERGNGLLCCTAPTNQEGTGAGASHKQEGGGEWICEALVKHRVEKIVLQRYC